MKRDLQKLSEKINFDIPIAAGELVAAGYTSRTSLWRFQRAGMPVTRIGRKIYIKFSDLQKANQTNSDS